MWAFHSSDEGFQKNREFYAGIVMLVGAWYLDGRLDFLESLLSPHE
jgi:hypothetical protein